MAATRYQSTLERQLVKEVVRILGALGRCVGARGHDSS
jgi:hypothetical protein